MAIIKRRKHREVTDLEKKERGNRIKYLRKILRYSSRAFGEKFNTKDSTLKSWEQGRHTGLTAEGALSIVNACKKEGVINCTVEWLLYGKGQLPEIKADVFPNIAGNTISQELALFYELHPHAIDTIVHDNSMEPCFNKGDHVAGTRCFESQEISKLLGLNCIIQLKTGETVVRQLTKGDQAGCYTLIGINQSAKLSTLKNVQLFSAAYIIWLRKPELIS
ncbi:MAG: hypothetical protein K0S27_1431 [Gammaproteobacteria bacterium]|jgi:DNA-binding transcriptional regulator YiaG|nr:hypothetical protein [Gammaproteobacteria bacterium]